MNVLTAVAADVARFWSNYGNGAVLTVGAVIALLGAFLGWRWFRSGEAYRRTGTIAVALATAFASEGMWEVARESLRLDWYIALVLFAMFEIVMVNQAQTAKHKLALKPPGNARKHMTFVWLLAGASGAVASLNADGVVEFVLRLIAPSVAAGIWWTTLTAEGVAKTPDAITWTITPRRILVRLGFAEPGERDVIQVDRERRIAAMTVTAHRLHGGTWFSRLRLSKLRRLALAADDAMVDEVQRRVQRVHLIEALTAPAERNDEGATAGATGATAKCNDDRSGSALRAPERATAPQRTSPTLQALDPQLAAVARGGRGPKAAGSTGRNGVDAQVSTGATASGADRSDAALYALAAPIVARSLAETGLAPSQRSMRNQLAKSLQPAPGFRKVGELIGRATAAHRERSERPATDDHNDDPNRPRVNGRDHELVMTGA